MFKDKEFINFIKKSKKNKKDIVLINILNSQDTIYQEDNTTMIVDNNGEFVGSINNGEFKQNILIYSKDILLKGKGEIVLLGEKEKSLNSIKIWMEPFYFNDNFGSLSYALEDASKGINNTLIRSTKHSGAHSFSPTFDKRDTFFNEEKNLFYQRIISPFKVLILGAQSGCEALVKMTDILGWQTFVCDTKETNLFNVNSADEKILLKKQEDSFCIAQQSFDAAIIMSSDFNSDITYLKSLLQGNMSYIGIIGSNENTKKIIETLKKSKNIKIDSKLQNITTWELENETQQSLALCVCSDIEAFKNNTPHLSLKNEENLLSKSA